MASVAARSASQACSPDGADSRCLMRLGANGGLHGVGDAPPEADIAALDALVQGERRVVTARGAALALGISSTAAKAALRSYALAHPEEVAVVWAVASRDEGEPLSRRVTLVRRPSADARSRAAVWAVAPTSGAPPDDTPDAWVSHDRARDLSLVTEVPAKKNSLRVECTSVFRSSSASWDDAPRRADVKSESRVGVTAAVEKPVTASTAVGEGKAAKDREANLKKAKRGTSRLESLVERIKAEDEAREKARAAQKTAAAGRKGQLATSSKPEKVPPREKPKRASKVESRTLQAKGPSRRTRRVVASDDEDENEVGSNGSKDSDDENENGRAELDREAEEAEEAQRCREALDLSSPVVPGEADGEAPSQLRTDSDGSAPDASKSGKVARSVFSATSRKHTREEVSTPATSSKRTCRVVEETVKEGGYLITRRVTKYFDEDGKEIATGRSHGEDQTPSDASHGNSNATSAVLRPKANPESNSSTGAVEPSKPKPKSKLGASGATKRTGVHSRPSGGVSKKNTKKSQGSIVSFFSKK